MEDKSENWNVLPRNQVLRHLYYWGYVHLRCRQSNQFKSPNWNFIQMQTYEKILPPWHNFDPEKEKEEKIINSKSKVIPLSQITCGGGIRPSFLFNKIHFGLFCKLFGPFRKHKQNSVVYISLFHNNFIILNDIISLIKNLSKMSTN